MNLKTLTAKNGLRGMIEIPADKSISHRAAILSMLTGGKCCRIDNFSKGADCHSTLSILRSLGCEISFLSEQNLIIDATKAMKSSDLPLFCGNSGTTMRLMTGILSAQKFNSTLTGDESLSRRPMKRVINPLALMGAQIRSIDCTAPLSIIGQKLHGIEYESELSSAQVKSAVLLAGLFACGKTIYTEKSKSRNHTELMLKYLGADITTKNTSVEILPSKLEPKPFTICGDISSAAFFMVAAAIVPKSDITLTNVGVNPTRSGILKVMTDMGANIELKNFRHEQMEPIADIRIRYSNLKATTINGDIIPTLIDELPIIALLATQAEGTTVIGDAQDLRNKEADRIHSIKVMLNKMGANIEETNDGFIIVGKSKLIGDCVLESFHDHRIAMTLFVASLIAQKACLINEFEWVNISFPEFEELMSKVIKN